MPHQRAHKVWTEAPGGLSTHRITPIRHDFHAHPLMALPALAELARRLAPSAQCRFIDPASRTQSDRFHHTPAPPDGRGIDEVFARIEEPGSWVALYNVETDPAYRAFLGEVMAPLRAQVEAEQPGIFNVGGFIFISAPPSVTPFHIDRENNFWLQVAGRKTITVWDHRDREVVPAALVDRFIMYGSLDDVRLRVGHEARGSHFDVGPGEGVYFPATSPHATRTHDAWVRPGDGVSISIGVVFYTSVTRRHARVHQANDFLRRLGFSPAPPGTSGWRDAAKAPLGQALAAFRARFRGYHPPPGAS